MDEQGCSLAASWKPAAALTARARVLGSTRAGLLLLALSISSFPLVSRPPPGPGLLDLPAPTLSLFSSLTLGTASERRPACSREPAFSPASARQRPPRPPVNHDKICLLRNLQAPRPVLDLPIQWPATSRNLAHRFRPSAAIVWRTIKLYSPEPKLSELRSGRVWQPTNPRIRPHRRPVSQPRAHPHPPVPGYVSCTWNIGRHSRRQQANALSRESSSPASCMLLPHWHRTQLQPCSLAVPSAACCLYTSRPTFLCLSLVVKLSSSCPCRIFLRGPVRLQTVAMSDSITQPRS